MRKMIALLVSTFVLAALALVVPVTNLVPEKNQSTASAVNAAKVYNWRYSDNSVMVWSNRDARGYRKTVYPGQLFNNHKDGSNTESLSVAPRCRTKVDTLLAPATWVDNRNAKTTWKTYNIPYKFQAQRLIIEVHC